VDKALDSVRRKRAGEGRGGKVLGREIDGRGGKYIARRGTGME